MKSQAEFRKGGAGVWGIVVGLAIVGMAVGKMMWKRRAAEQQREARVEAVREVVADHGKLITCLQNGQRDVVTGVLVLDLHGLEDTCSSEIERLQQELRDVNEMLGLDAPSATEVSNFNIGDPQSLVDALCTWVEAVARDTNQLVTEVALPRVVEPSCDRKLSLLEHVRSPETQKSRANQVVVADAELQVRYDNEDGTYTLARTKDGARWATKVMPRGWFEHYHWSDRGFVALARERPDHPRSPYRVYLLVDGTWQVRGKLSVEVVHQVLLSPADRVIVVAGPSGAGQNQLWHSRDRGKTFTRALEPGGKLGVPADHAAVLADGATLVMSAPARGPARFEAHTFDPKGTGPVQAASLTWPTSPESLQEGLETCRAGAAVWAVVRGRHVLFSETGRAWREVQDLGSDVEVHQIACSLDQLAVASGGDAGALRTCDRTRCSDRIALQRTRSATIALRFDGPKLEVWYGVARGGGSRPSHTSPIGVYEVAGSKLVLARIHAGTVGGGLPVVHDEHGFFALFRE